MASKLMVDSLAPRCTDFPVQDIVRWLDEGIIVRLYDSRNEKTSIVFDKHCKREKEAVLRVMWIDFQREAKMLEEKNVPNHLKTKNYTLCVCSIGKEVAKGAIVSTHIYRRDFTRPRLLPLFEQFGPG